MKKEHGHIVTHVKMNGLSNTINIVQKYLQLIKKEFKFVKNIKIWKIHTEIYLKKV